VTDTVKYFNKTGKSIIIKRIKLEEKAKRQTTSIQEK